MSGTGFFILIVVVIFFGYRYQISQFNKPGDELAEKFLFLGKLVGKTREQIIAKVGYPTSRSVMSEGKELLQWQAGGYHIALLFDGDICEGITHEIKVNV